MTNEPEPIWQFVAKVLARKHQQAAEPQPTPRREHGVIAEICDVCGNPVDSDAHVNHCGG